MSFPTFHTRPVVRAALLLTALFCARVVTSAPASSEAAPPEKKPATHRAKKELEDQGTIADFKRVGEAVASRIDRIVRKKSFEAFDDPWLLQGIPLVFPSSRNGFNLGIKVAAQDIKRQDPEKLEIDAQVLASDMGRYKHHLWLDIPHAFGDKLRLIARAQYDRDISLPYFGIGNNNPVDMAAYNANSYLYQNVRAGPSFNLQLLWYANKYFRIGPTVGLRWTSISAPAGSLLARQQPTGVNGGRTHYIGVGAVYEDLDWEPYPSRGSMHALYFLIYNKGFTGSDYNFWRATYTYWRYITLHRRLILAHRTLFEVLNGDVPYYELGAIGGLSPALSIGGGKFLRGIPENQFIDKIRLIMGFELRWDPLFFAFAKQDITVGFVPFFDIGRVWNQLLPFDLGHWHASVGWGARLIWNSRFIIRTDMALSDAGPAFYLDLGSSF